MHRHCLHVSEHMNKLSNLDGNHSPSLTYIQLLFSVTEPYWWFPNIFSARLLPSGNDNHTISLDFINTPPQVLVLLPQVASVSLSSSPDITHTLGKLMVSPPPPPATASSRKAACWVYLHHQWELILAASRLQLPGHQLPQLRDIWKNNLCIPLLQYCFWLLSPLCRNWPAAMTRVQNYPQKGQAV